MAGVTRPGHEPTFCYVVRVQHKIVHGGITDDLARARAESRARWPAAEVVQVGVGMTRQTAEEWARKNRYDVATTPRDIAPDRGARAPR